MFYSYQHGGQFKKKAAMEVWKEFEQNIVTHSAAHHLTAIDELLNKNGYARVTDVAKKLNITRGSVSITLKTLKERGLVVEDENKFLKLSEKGNSIARLISLKRHVLTKFFKDILQVPEDIATIDACKIEHLISTQTGERLLVFMNFLLNDRERSKKLLKEFSNFQHKCGNTENCEVCEPDCLLADKKLVEEFLK
ncbi:MAG: metal-dependent transcriptional regulator [Calditrichaeota bacterium]|nr:MAG: metal-dependent transcriptional regulator [Calditrichota bacterium]